MNYKITEHNELTIITFKTRNYEISLTDYGAGITDIKSYDKYGALESVALGYQDYHSFINDKYYLGKTVGRFAGRIYGGKFILNNQEYQLSINEQSSNSNLHSGNDSISFKRFDYEIIEDDEMFTKVIFTITENEKDFPGKMKYRVCYTIYEDFFMIENTAKANKTTLCNMTNHVYFNLCGNFKQPITNQYLQLPASKYLNLNNLEIEDVNETMDFRSLKLIGEDINALALSKTKGYDHYFMFDDQQVATLIDKENGRMLEISGNSTGVVCYSGGYFNGTKTNQSGKLITKDMGITFEFQSVPNGINIQTDDTSILNKDEEFYQFMIYKFNIYN